MRKVGFLLLGLLAAPLVSQAGECKVAVIFEKPAGGQRVEVDDQLTSALAQAPNIEVTGSQQVEGPVALEEATRLGKGAGADVVILGNIKGEVYRLEARVIEVKTGAVLANPKAEGGRAEVFDLVDALGRKVADNLSGGGTVVHRLAVLDFGNGAAAEYAPFVQGLPDMLATNLGAAGRVGLAERGEIEAGMRRFAAPDAGGYSPAAAAEIGQWLGVDWVVVGHFTEMVEIRIKLVEVRTGRLLVEQTSEGGSEALGEEVEQLAGELAKQLFSFSQNLRKVAVLGFENHASAQYEGFVRGISDMLMTSLSQAGNLLVIERVQIERAMQNFALELSGPIDNEKAVEIGQWLGADEVVLGGFTNFGEVFRIDARLISARTGELLVAQNVRGGEQEVMALVDQLGTRLVASLAERDTEIQGGTGELRVQFMIGKSEMGERPVYRQLCKLYVDGKYLGLSQVVGRGQEWTSVFQKRVRAGKHEVQLVHGFVKDGAWDGETPQQPRIFQVVVEPGQTATLQYCFEVGWYEDRYRYAPPWR